jgi:hypothetical protein
MAEHSARLPGPAGGEGPCSSSRGSCAAAAAARNRLDIRLPAPRAPSYVINHDPKNILRSLQYITDAPQIELRSELVGIMTASQPASLQGDSPKHAKHHGKGHNPPPEEERAALVLAVRAALGGSIAEVDAQLKTGGEEGATEAQMLRCVVPELRCRSCSRSRPCGGGREGSAALRRGRRHSSGRRSRVGEKSERAAAHTHAYTHMPPTNKTPKRWLAARGWDPERAAHDLAAHASWRAAFAPAGRVLDEEVANDIAQRKLFVQGPSAGGKGVVVFVGKNHIPRCGRRGWGAAALYLKARGSTQGCIHTVESQPGP